MSTPDPERAMEHDAEKLEERIDKLDGSIDDAQKKQTEHRAKDPGPLDEDDDSSADDDDGNETGNGGFDDPEAEEEEDD